MSADPGCGFCGGVLFWDTAHGRVHCAHCAWSAPMAPPIDSRKLRQLVERWRELSDAIGKSADALIAAGAAGAEAAATESAAYRAVANELEALIGGEDGN